MFERRKFQRGRTYLGGRIAYDKPCTTDDCLVRNLSESGAKLVFSGATMIPNEFDLTLRESGETRRVRIVWRKDLHAGVALAGSEAEPALPRETARRIRALESDRDALARRLAYFGEPMR
jgi:hypothetical protein